MRPRALGTAFLFLSSTVTSGISSVASAGALECREYFASRLDAASRTVPAFSAADARVVDVVGRIRTELHVPLSFVETPTDVRVTIASGSSTLKGLLDALVSSSGGHYRYGTLKGRLVVYPTDPIYDEHLLETGIVNAPRLESAHRYVGLLRARNPFFGQWIGPIVVGTDPYHHLLTDRVSLSTEASVVEHLSELAGRARSVVFTVAREHALGGVFVLNFIDVPSFQTITIRMAVPKLLVGQEAALTVVGHDWVGTEADVTAKDCGTQYASVVESVAVVDSGGVVRGVGPGRTMISVWNNGTSAQLVVDVLEEKARR